MFLPLCQERSSLGFADGGSCISVQVSWISKTDSGNGLIWFILTETGQKNLRRALPMASPGRGDWSALGVRGDAQLGQRGGWTGQLLPQPPIHTHSNHYRFQWQIFKNAADKTLLSITSSTGYTSILIWTSWDSTFFVYVFTYTHVSIYLDALATKS